MTIQDTQQWTGAQVAEWRGEHGIAAAWMTALCGFNSARLYTIEKKNVWKPGDLETILDVMQRVEAGELPTVRTAGLELPEPPQRPHSEPRVPKVKANGRDRGKPGDVHMLGINELLDADEETGTIVAWTTPDPRSVAATLAEPSAAPTEPAYVPNRTLPLLPSGARRVSNGELQTFKRCRRKWYLTWIRHLGMRYEDLTTKRAGGTRVHRALEAYYLPRGLTPTDPRDALERVITEDWTTICRQLDELKSRFTEDEIALRRADLADRFQKAVALDRAMIAGYVEWLAETGADSDLVVTAPEAPLAAEFEMDLDEHEKLLVQLVALIDVRTQRISDGVRLIVDHKTVDSLTTPEATFHMNEQMLHYHLVEWLSSKEGEARCDGALYNMLRRSKRTTAAKPPFFARVEVRHSATELQSYKRRLEGTVREMVRAERALAAGTDPLEVAYPTPMPGNCEWACDFFAICGMFDDGSRVEDAITGLYREGDPWARYDRLQPPR